MAVGGRRLLLVSSGGTVYGPPQSLPITESHATAPISPYGITKLTINHYALMFHHTRDLPVVVVRPANAFGIQQRSRTGQGFLAAAIDATLSVREIEIYGEAGTIRDFIHVSDLASGILAGLKCGDNGEIYNLGSGIGTCNLDVVAMLRPMAEAAGHAIWVPTFPHDVSMLRLMCSTPGSFVLPVDGDRMFVCSVVSQRCGIMP